MKGMPNEDTETIYEYATNLIKYKEKKYESQYEQKSK